MAAYFAYVLKLQIKNVLDESAVSTSMQNHIIQAVLYPCTWIISSY